MKKIILLIISILLCVVLGGCGSFFGSDEPDMVTGITTEELENGRTKVTITYADENRAPDVFEIGGARGNGIASIVTEEKDDGSGMELRIKFTDESAPDVTFEITNGVSVIGVETEKDDETGNTYMYLKYSDGTLSDPIWLPKGDEGDGFIGYDNETFPDGSQRYTFHFREHDDVIVNIPAPEKGEEGRGIVSISPSEEEVEGKYVLIVTYSDGTTSDPIEFDKPLDPNRWYNGGTIPDGSLGKDGDYYFDIFHNTIYVKENNQWTLIVNLNQENITYTIRFELNDSIAEPAQMPSDVLREYQVKKGTYFKDNGYNAIPIPTRVGYRFMGWYTSINITPTTGRFDDLTVIAGDLVLYACWEKII